MLNQVIKCLFLMLFFHHSVSAEEWLAHQLNSFEKRNKNAYLYCVSLTHRDTKTCLPVKKVSVMIDNSIESKYTLSEAKYENEVIEFRINPYISKTLLKRELEDFQNRLLDPL